jgi:hypothetical protein
VRENAELHAFVSDGPIFRHPVSVTVGELAVRDGFAFRDLPPGF